MTWFMTRTDYLSVFRRALYFEQEGTCPLCETEEAIHLDHDHSCCTTLHVCSCIRGMLCKRCNLKLKPYEYGVRGVEGKEWEQRAALYLTGDHL